MRFGLALLALLAALLAALQVGAADYGLQDVLKDETARTVMLEIRLPRLIVAALAGAALSAAGVLSQGLFRNPLASPSILGTEAGASLAAAFAFHAGLAFAAWWTLPLAAFGGALASTAVLFALARRGERNRPTPLATLLLAGFALNALLGAGTSLLLSLLLEDFQRSSAALHWLLGGFAGKGAEHIPTIALPAVLGFALAVRLAPRLDALSLGEDVAQSLAVDLASMRRATFGAVALLVGGAAAVSGAVPFVGLVVPHLTRSMAGPRHGTLLVLSTVNGATLMLLCDLVARTIRSPRELEVGVITALLGAPFFLALLLRKDRP